MLTWPTGIRTFLMILNIVALKVINQFLNRLTRYLQNSSTGYALEKQIKLGTKPISKILLFVH